MAISASRKKANSKWDKENMATLACKVKKEEAQEFKAYCAINDTTVNNELKSYVQRCIDPNSAPDDKLAAATLPTIPAGMVVKIKEHITKTGEQIPEFVDRAINERIRIDESSALKFGLNPAEMYKEEQVKRAAATAEKAAPPATDHQEG